MSTLPMIVWQHHVYQVAHSCEPLSLLKDSPIHALTDVMHTHGVPLSLMYEHQFQRVALRVIESGCEDVIVRFFTPLPTEHILVQQFALMHTLKTTMTPQSAPRWWRYLSTHTPQVHMGGSALYQAVTQLSQYLDTLHCPKSTDDPMQEPLEHTTFPVLKGPKDLVLPLKVHVEHIRALLPYANEHSSRALLRLFTTLLRPSHTASLSHLLDSHAGFFHQLSNRLIHTMQSTSAAKALYQIVHSLCLHPHLCPSSPIEYTEDSSISPNDFKGLIHCTLDRLWQHFEHDPSTQAYALKCALTPMYASALLFYLLSRSSTKTLHAFGLYPIDQMQEAPSFNYSFSSLPQHVSCHVVDQLIDFSKMQSLDPLPSLSSSPAPSEFTDVPLPAANPITITSTSRWHFLSNPLALTPPQQHALCSMIESVKLFEHLHQNVQIPESPPTKILKSL